MIKQSHHQSVDILNQDNYQPTPIQSHISQNAQENNQQMNVELSASKKQMLQRFKKSVGYYKHLSKQTGVDSNILCNISSNNSNQSDRVSLSYSESSQRNKTFKPPSMYPQEDQCQENTTLKSKKLKHKNQGSFSIETQLSIHKQPKQLSYIKQVYDKDKKQYSFKESPKGIIKKSSSFEKKVRIQIPQTIKELQRMQAQYLDELRNSVKIITSNNHFKKLCFHKSKIEQVNMSFSVDFKFLMVSITSNHFNCFRNKNKIISMKDFMGVSAGFKSKNFQNYLNQNNRISEDNALSIIFKERTFDLLADCQQSKNKFIRAVKIVKSYI